MKPKPVFFESAKELRAWFAEHHRTADELWIGFRKVHTGEPSVTPKEALDEALCVGWIDGVRKGIDDRSYTNRYTPRKAGSSWSARNIARMKELVEAGRAKAAGKQAFALRDEEQANRHSYELQHARLTPAMTRTFRADPKAWAFFRSQPPGYRRTAAWWVVSAKRPETRERRLATLIDDSAHGRRIAMLRPSRSGTSGGRRRRGAS